MSRDARYGAASARPLRVAIDARIPHGEAGGVEAVIIGLAKGISSLEGSEEYLFLTQRNSDDWIRPHLRGNTQAIPVPGAVRRRLQRVRAGLRSRMPAAARAYRRLRSASGVTAGPPPSDGTIERLGADVVHFVHQGGFRTSVPSIYHPHDLQHRHLPQLFSVGERAFRDRWYRELCDQATTVAVASSWTRSDVIVEMGLPAEKVWVVPWASPLDAFDSPLDSDVESIARDLDLPDRFLFYPAQTWRHKNHEALLEAVHLLRERTDNGIFLVFSGRRNQEAGRIDASVHRFGLSDRVRWLGFVEPNVLAAIYRLATAVVIPSKFEAASAPLWEAFAAGVPAACSNVTSLPDQAGDAALLFDPESPEEIANAIVRLWTDHTLRNRLIVRGKSRVRAFTWERTAKLFRAHYRRVAGTTPTEEDVALLSAPPLL